MSPLDTVKWQLSRLRTMLTMMAAPILPYSPPDAVDLHGKRALVTGANVGIGKEIALWLARQGAEVFLLCRNEQKAGEACEDIQRRTGNEKVFIEVIDMGSFASVKAFLERWGKRSPDDRTIDILVNNAAMCTSKKVTTADGFEVTYEVNHLSGFLLTTRLLNHGCLTPKSRIIILSSVGMNDSPPLKPDDMNASDILNGIEEGGALEVEATLALYSRTKAMQVIWTRELQDRLSRTSQLSGIMVQTCHPGFVKSSIWSREDGAGAFKSTPFGVYVNNMLDRVGISNAQ
ncbi:hypothetical protein FRB99_000636, partial [Tulasnella sp. 403]